MDRTATYYAIVAPIFIQRYYPPQQINAQAVEVLSLVGNILGLPALIPGGAGAVASGVSAVYGVAGSAMARKLGGQTTAIKDAADMATYKPPSLGNRFQILTSTVLRVAHGFINSSRTVIQNMHDSLINDDGTFESPMQSITEFFDEGAMVDHAKIPLISTDKGFGISETDLAGFYSNWLHAKILNWAWRRRGVYILAFEMSREECKHISPFSPPRILILYFS